MRHVPALSCLIWALAGAAAASAAPPTGTAATARFDAAIAGAKAAMMSAPTEALARARAAEAIARALPPGAQPQLAEASAQWLEGEATARLQEPRAALPTLERALATVTRLAPRAKLRGDILLSRGWAESAIGNVQQALNDFQQAHGLFRAIGETRGQARALQNIAGIYHDAGDNERSLRYYAEAADISAADPAIALAAHNNVGETLKTLGRYGAAEAEYRKALVLARAIGGPLLEVGILTNLASAQLLSGDAGAAEATARRALASTTGREAADERPFVFGVLAQIALKRGDLPVARALIDRTFAGVDLAHSTTAFRDFHETAATIYQRVGDSDLAYRHLAAFKRIDDDTRAIAASTNAALMAARFDFTNQKYKISQLETEQLRRERTFEQSRANLRSIIFSIVLVAIGIVFALMLLSVRSLRLSRDRVRAANGQLSDANVSLEKALKAKTEFLATTSHEIRTPLNGILGMTQVMLADPRVDAEMRGRIEVVHGAGETMRALVDDILDMAKIETGKLSIQRSTFDLTQLMGNAAHFWRARAQIKGVALRLHVMEGPLRIEEDEAKLRQILFNLMSNAIKFTPAGAVTLSARIEGADGAERLVIAVADTGIGIPEDQRERVFEKFHQVDGGTSRQFAGTGLGLAICRSLALALEGDIALESRIGAGSTFLLDLPLHRAPADADEARAGPRPAASRVDQAAVLLVEPNALTQRILAKGLRDTVAQVDCASDSASAIEKLALGGIDHVVAQAEDAEGIVPLLAAARAAGARSTILFTPGASLDAAAFLMRGATQALAKPIAPTALAAALAALHAVPDQPAAVAA